jgi:hypothetical protein
VKSYFLLCIVKLTIFRSQLYAFAAGTGAANIGGVQMYQGLINVFTSGDSYTLTYSYRIDFLNVLSGTLDATTNYCYLFLAVHDSDNTAQPGFIRLYKAVPEGTGEWQTVTRVFTYPAGFPTAESDEFTLQLFCNAPTASLEIGVTVDDIVILPV